MMKKRMMVILLISMALILLACSDITTRQTKDEEEHMIEVNTAGKVVEYTNIKPEDAKKRLESTKGTILLDVRTPEEYAEEHIPGSILIPLDELSEKAAGMMTDKDAEIIIYCRSGNRSVTAANALIEMGYTHVYNLGGIKDWPYEKESGAPKNE